MFNYVKSSTEVQQDKNRNKFSVLKKSIALEVVT